MAAFPYARSIAGPSADQYFYGFIISAVPIAMSIPVAPEQIVATAKRRAPIRVLACGAVAWLTACATPAPTANDTVHAFDAQPSSGAVRADDDVSLDVRRLRNDATDPRIAALKAAAETEPRAAYDLGLRYFRGDGVRQDRNLALAWMRRAAERGDLPAQKALGGFYLFGLEETGADPREAERWLQLATSQGDQESRKLLIAAKAGKPAHRDESSRDESKWKRDGRSSYYDDWSRGYPYRGYWDQGAWQWSAYRYRHQ